jgi:predicted RNA-binding Zn ribbon-like protein
LHSGPASDDRNHANAELGLLAAPNRPFARLLRSGSASDDRNHANGEWCPTGRPTDACGNAQVTGWPLPAEPVSAYHGGVDFVRYADFAARLVNADLESPDGLKSHLESRRWLAERVEERDLAPLKRLRRELRPIFEASDRGDEAEVVRLVNALLTKHPVTPYIAGHDRESWHLHVSEKGSSVAALITAECVMGLATLVVDFGPTRLGVCSADRCEQVFVDTSPNRSRRYCSDRCSSRANVAAYRARRKSGVAL